MIIRKMAYESVMGLSALLEYLNLELKEDGDINHNHGWIIRKPENPKQ